MEVSVIFTLIFILNCDVYMWLTLRHLKGDTAEIRSVELRGRGACGVYNCKSKIQFGFGYFILCFLYNLSTPIQQPQFQIPIKAPLINTTSGIIKIVRFDCSVKARVKAED